MRPGDDGYFRIKGILSHSDVGYWKKDGKVQRCHIPARKLVRTQVIKPNVALHSISAFGKNPFGLHRDSNTGCYFLSLGLQYRTSMTPLVTELQSGFPVLPLLPNNNFLLPCTVVILKIR